MAVRPIQWRALPRPDDPNCRRRRGRICKHVRGGFFRLTVINRRALLKLFCQNLEASLGSCCSKGPAQSCMTTPTLGRVSWPTNCSLRAVFPSFSRKFESELKENIYVFTPRTYSHALCRPGSQTVEVVVLRTWGHVDKKDTIL